MADVWLLLQGAFWLTVPLGVVVVLGAIWAERRWR